MDTPEKMFVTLFLFPKGFITDFDFSKDPLRIYPRKGIIS